VTGVNRTVQFVLSPVLVVFENKVNTFYTGIHIKMTMFYSGKHTQRYDYKMLS